MAQPGDTLSMSVKCRNAFKDLLPIRVYRSHRLRRVLKRGWTNNLSAVVWNEFKLPCCLRWKVANVRRDDVYCAGSCVQCQLVITCIAEKKKLNFTIQNYEAGVEHDSKYRRKMNQVDKEKYQAMLKGRSAFDVRNQLADELMDAGDPLCPLIPSDNALRIVKHEIDCSQESTIDALLTLKKQFPNEIGSIVLDPFHVFYSTDLQKAYLKKECHGRKRITLSIDATGIGSFK